MTIDSRSASELLAEFLANQKEIDRLRAVRCWYEGYAAGTRDTTSIFTSLPWKTKPYTPNPYEEDA